MYLLLLIYYSCDYYYNYFCQLNYEGYYYYEKETCEKHVFRQVYVVD